MAGWKTFDKAISIVYKYNAIADQSVLVAGEVVPRAFKVELFAGIEGPPELHIHRYGNDDVNEAARDPHGCRIGTVDKYTLMGGLEIEFPNALRLINYDKGEDEDGSSEE